MRPLSGASATPGSGTPVLWKPLSVSSAPLWQVTQFAFPMKGRSPASSSAVRALPEPCGRPASSAATYRSKRVGAKPSRRSYAAIALPMFA